MMQAIAFDHYGAPDKLKLVSLPIPKPQRDTDVVVQVKAFALNPVDYKVRSNGLSGKAANSPVPAAQSPLVVGFDAAGIVTATGPKVKKFQVGDEVYFSGSLDRPGSYAEYTVVDERIAAHKPKSLDFVQAATVPLVTLTAYEAIHEQMHVPLPASLEQLTRNRAKSILIVAGAGGVGSIASQLAKHLFKIGQVISTASRADSIKFCLEHGADFTVSHTQPLAPQLAAAPHKLSGVDYIFNCADHADPDELIALLNPFGYYTTIVGFPKKPNVDVIFFKRATVTAEMMFARPLTNIEPERQGAILAHMAELLDTHVVQHTCTRVFPFSVDNVIEATKLQESGHHTGKIAVTLSK